MILPNAPSGYSPPVETERNRRLMQADAENFKRRQNLELVDEKLILHSPNGTAYTIMVTDAGALVPALTAGLTGQAMTAAVGTPSLVITGDQWQSVTGQAMTAGQGALLVVLT